MNGSGARRLRPGGQQKSTVASHVTVMDDVHGSISLLAHVCWPGHTPIVRARSTRDADNRIAA